MKNIPIPTAKSARQLPTPQIKEAIVQQAVDLKPAGATVAITTVADNPFEARQGVTVVTQASGGMAATAPAPRPSRGIMHSFLPGLGESNTVEKADSGWGQAAQTLLTSAADTAVTREERKRAEYEARIAEAQARGQEARSAADIAMSNVRRGITSTSIDLFGMKVNLPMLLAGGGLLTFALLRRKKAKGRKGRRK